MRRLAVLGGIAAVAVVGAGFAIAQEDPIGGLLSGKSTPPPEMESPPPAVTEIPKAVAPTPPSKVEPKVTAAPLAAKEKVAAIPSRRPRYPIAILQAMDKITAESIRFEARVDKPVSYKGLVLTVRACETTTGDEPVRDAIANVEIGFRPPATSRMRQPGVRQVYRGWMFAASPSISPLEHPVYDAWLIACKADGPLQAPVVTSAAIEPEAPIVMPKAGAKTAAPKAKVESLAPAPVIVPEARPEPAAPPPPPPPAKAPEAIVIY